MRLLLCFVTVVVAVVLAACGGATAGDDRPLVVVTTNVLGDVVTEVAGDDARVEVLIPPGADPHGFEPSPRRAALLEDADLVIANGLGLEEGLAVGLGIARAARVEVLEVGPRLDPRPIPGGDAPDPHVWTDPRRMARAAQLVGAALDELGIASARRRADRYAATVLALDRELADGFAGIPAPRRRLVTNHHVFGYFAQRYGFTVVGAVLPSATTLAEPSPADLAELVDTLRRERVSTIFADSSHPTRLARALAAEARLEVEVVALHTESLGPPGSAAATYVGMMRSNGRAIARSLER